MQNNENVDIAMAVPDKARVTAYWRRHSYSPAATSCILVEIRTVDMII
jgi:hypothetical protein